MGLISKIEDKLSGNKHDTTKESVDSTGRHSGSSNVPGAYPSDTSTGTDSHLRHPVGSSTQGSSGITGGTHPSVTGQDVTSGSGLGGHQTGTHDGRGLTGGSHLGSHGASHTGSGLTGNTHAGHLNTGATHSGISSGPHHGSGLTNDPYSGNNTGVGSGLTGGSHGAHGGPHHGSGLSSNPPVGSHTGVGSGITGGTAVGSGIGGAHSGSHVGNEALGSSHRREAGDIGSRDYAPGSNVGGGSHGISHDSHTTPRQPFDPYSSKGQRIAANAADNRHGYDDPNVPRSRTGGITNSIQDTDFVPGSSSAAQNPSAIPTAGGQRVGGDNVDSSSHGHHGGVDNRGFMEKTKDKLSSSRTDRPDDPVTGRNYNEEARGTTGHSSSHAGSGTAAGLVGGAAAGSALGSSHHGQQGVASGYESSRGTHAGDYSSGHTSTSHTTPGHGLTGHSTTGHSTAGHGLTSGQHQPTGNTSYGDNVSYANRPSADTPLANDPSYSQRHHNTGAGLATGAVAGAGAAGLASHHNQHGQHESGGLTGHNQPGSGPGSSLVGHTQGHSQDPNSQYAAGQQAAYNQHSSGGVVDNRSATEKIKDKVIPSRTDAPDNYQTGQNYGQSQHGSGTGPSGYTSNEHGTHAAGGAYPIGSVQGGAGQYPGGLNETRGVGSSQQYTGTSGIPGTHHQGSEYPQHSGIGQHSHGVHDGGVGGVTQGVSNLGVGHGQHGSHNLSSATGGVGSGSGADALKGKLGGAYEAGYRDAVEHMRAEQNRQ